MFTGKLPKIFWLLLTAASLFPVAGSRAAEFDIDGGRTVLRRLQYCQDCGAALLVTRVQPGIMVRCPDCGREQPRLHDQYLLTQAYQLCRLCEAPLDPHGHRPSDVVECDNCHTRQHLSADAFVGDRYSGLGFMPGFPPGSGKKKLLYSPERVDATISPVPLDGQNNHPGSIPELPGVTIPIIPLIPRPPDGFIESNQTSTPDVPTMSMEKGTAPTSVPEPSSGKTSGAVDVPAVTADLFGGSRKLPGTSKTETFSPGGKIIARVDGEPIYAEQVDRIVNPAMQRLRGQSAPGGDAGLILQERELRQEVLERLIDRELVVREAAAAGHRPDSARVRERETELARILAGQGVDIRREAERDVVMSDMRRLYAEKPGSANPEAVREFYRLNRDKMMRPRLLALSQLVVFQDRIGRADPRNHREIALEISAQLEQGARFDELRSRYDEFGRLAGQGLAEPQLLPESAYAAGILQAAGSLRSGAVFGPLFLEGMALFGKVVEDRPAGPVPFEEVEKDIRRRLEAEDAERSLDEWLKRLRQKAQIDILDEEVPR